MATRTTKCERLGLCAVLLASLLPAGACAQGEVYKCRDASGQTSYQDAPCPPGTEQPAPVLSPAPPYVPSPAASLPAPPSPHTAAGTRAEATPRLPSPPLPALFRCERYDGQETYVTEDPVPRVYQVPLWAVMPEKTSSISGGLSTSRPPQGGGSSLMGAYTTVQDRCRRMGRAELCQYWSQRAETVRDQARIAFNDTRPALERELAGLREQRASHCGA